MRKDDVDYDVLESLRVKFIFWFDVRTSGQSLVLVILLLRILELVFLENGEEGVWVFLTWMESKLIYQG